MVLPAGSDDASKHEIDIPTVHVIGSKDENCHLGISLFKSCCEDNASLFDLGNSQGFLQDDATWRELSLVVCEALRQVEILN